MNRRKVYALGRLKAGVMNRTEEAYARELQDRLHAGTVLWYKFEGLKFKLADNTTYTPDFVVMLADGMIELHEVKGYWIGDAKVKIKVAADLYPFQFRAIHARPKKEGGGWEVVDF